MSIKVPTVNTTGNTLKFRDGDREKITLEIGEQATVSNLFRYFEREILKKMGSPSPKPLLEMALASNSGLRYVRNENWTQVFTYNEGTEVPLSQHESKTFLALPAATFTKEGQGVITWICYTRPVTREQKPSPATCEEDVDDLPADEWFDNYPPTTTEPDSL